MNPTDLILVLAGLYLLFRLWRLVGSRVDPSAAAAEIATGQAVLVDVREPGEWAGGVAEGAALLPLGDLQTGRGKWGPFLDQNRHRRLFLYCQSGSRSGFAAAKLRREGFDAVNAGTFHAWRRAGRKVVAPRSS
jgi:rhodanese-related sulfurtransferase